MKASVKPLKDIEPTGKTSSVFKHVVSPDTVEGTRKTKAGPLSFKQGDMDQRLRMLTDPASPEGEAFRLLYAKIRSKASRSKPCVIMVTSAQPLDGKTTVSSSLAVHMAKILSEEVILVDADLRAPMVGSFFGLRSENGLRDCLERGDDFDDYLVNTPLEKLKILPGAHPTSDSSHLLNSNNLKRLVNAFRKRAGTAYVIFDATPAFLFSETAFLASVMDGVLMVVRSGVTPKNLLEKSIENIGRKHIWGMIFNASQEQLAPMNYYYRYYKDAGKKDEARNRRRDRKKP